MSGGKTPNSLQERRRSSQWRKAMNWLSDMTLDYDSKLNSPWRKQDVSVKWTESVHNIYFIKSDFRFGLKSIRALYTGIFELSK